MNPERKVEIKLWDWLKTSKSNILEVYFNSKNEVGAPIFKVSGVQKKPDLIIKYNNGYGNKHCVVEVKDNSSSLNVIRADKIIDVYFKNYMDEKTEYLVEGEKIKIDCFVIATQDSVNGFLFKKESLIDNWLDKESKSKYAVSKKYKIIPRMEGHRTFEFIRLLWHGYNKIRNNYKTKVGLGILIGNTEDNLNPHLMITNYDSKKQRWGQRWWKI